MLFNILNDWDRSRSHCEAKQGSGNCTRGRHPAAARQSKSSARLAADLGWPASDVQPWFDGSFSFDVERAGQIAKALELDVPMFVGKALEVTLRFPKGGR